MRFRTLAARKNLVAAIAVAAIAAIAVPLGALSSQAAEPPPTRTIDLAADAALDVAENAAARAVAVTPAGSIGTSQLAAQMTRLVGSESLPAATVADDIGELQAETHRVDQAIAHEKAVKAAAAKKAKAAAKAKAAKKAKAAAKKARARANTPAGARATAQKLSASRYGWGSGQFSCLQSLWQRESGWNYRAYNPSGATGIPQALPGSKMGSVASDWRTNASTQIRWGLSYIKRGYGSPCAAWGHSQRFGWY